MIKIFRYEGCEVIHVAGGFRVRESRTQEVFCVQLELDFGKRTTGRCRCGNAAAELPVFQCRHQQALLP